MSGPQPGAAGGFISAACSASPGPALIPLSDGLPMSDSRPWFHGPGFERVREVFERNFTDDIEVGASFCAVVDGETVVDLWGG